MAAAAVAPVDRCVVYKYTCEDPETLVTLAAAAKVQQDKNAGFNETIQPWKFTCAMDDSVVHFVAQNTAGLICGWLAAGFGTRAGQTTGHIHEISTRRIKDAYYGGVGQALHAAFLEEAARRNVDFVYLFPLNEKVAAIYATPAWGYTQLDPVLKQMFRPLRAPPTPEFLDTLRGPTAESLLERAFALALAKPADQNARRLVTAAKPYVLSSKEIQSQLEVVLDTAEGTIHMAESEGEDIDMNEVRKDLVAFLIKMLTEAGKRLPRLTTKLRRRGRHTRRRKFA